MKLQNRARDIKTGEVIKQGTVSITGPDGNVLAASVSIDQVTGAWSFTSNGQPGYVKQTFSYQGQTKIIEGDSWGQNGWWCEGELTDVLRGLGEGVIANLDDGLPVTPQSGMTLQVGTGMALVRGVLFPVYDTSAASSRVTIATANATNPRKDRIVVRLERVTASATQTTPALYAGRCYLAVLTGPAAATPTAPAVTQSASIWEIPLATVTVPANATTILTANIDATDRTSAASFAPLVHTHTSASITDWAEAVQDTVGAALTDSTSIDFTYNDAAGTITAAVIYGGTGSAATAARSDHNHTGTYATAAHTHALATRVTARTNGTPPVVNPGATGIDTVYCNAGEVLTGGGCEMTGSQSTLLESFPFGSTAWRCRARNDSNNEPANIIVTAFCIAATT